MSLIGRLIRFLLGDRANGEAQVKFEEIDRWCDEFEERLKAGESISVHAFLAQHNLPKEAQLVAELEPIHEHYAMGATQKMTHHNRFGATQDFFPEESSQRTTDFSLAGKETAPSSISVPGYEILEAIGRGGMGAVYKARQIRADRIVALKVMLNLGSASHEELERFRVEAQASAQLLHPNIVQVFDVGDSDELPYFTQEYVPGGTLSKLVAKQLLEHRDTAEKMLQLSKAVAYAHSQGIIHRDLKPANILVAYDGSLKIADFGLARRIDSKSDLTRDGSVIGTPSYMAPEQASGSVHQIGPLCDVYSLGAILYELLTGRAPFKGASVWEVISMVRETPATPPSELQPGIPKDLETICLKCLEKEPSKRYVSAQELADDLQRYLRHEPILARPVGQWERLVRLCRRHPLEARLVGLAASLLVLLTIGAASAAWIMSIKNDQISMQRDEIAGQRDQITQEKEISDARLESNREAISTFVNRAPQYLEGVPLAKGARELIAELTESMLNKDSQQDTAQLGPSRIWGLLAIDIRRGEALLTEARSAKYDSVRQDEFQELVQGATKHFEEAHRLAQQVVDSGEGDQAKGLANLALTISRLAAAARLEEKPQAEQLFQQTLDLRKRASELPDGEAPQALRLAELGREYANLAEYQLQQASAVADAEEKEKQVRKSKDSAELAIEILSDALHQLPKDDGAWINVKRDYAIACRLAAEAAAVLHQHDTASELFASSNATYRELIELEPNRIGHVNNLLSGLQAFGDFLIVDLDDAAAARKQYADALVLQLEKFYFEPTLSDLREKGLAMGYYRVGLAELAQGNAEKSRTYFRRCEAIRDLELQQLRLFASADELVSQRIGLMLAQARSGNIEPAITEAHALAARAEEDQPTPSGFEPKNLLLQAAAGLSIAAEQPEAKDRADELREQAAAAMQAAIKNGFNDRHYLMTDPDLEALRTSKAYSDLLAAINHASGT